MKEIRKLLKLPDNPDSTEGYFTKEELKDILIYLQMLIKAAKPKE